MEEGLKISVLNHLQREHVGRRNAVKANQLAERFGIGLRDVNEIVRMLRKEGQLIGSSKIPPFGYYIPANDDEVKEYLNCFRSELIDMLETFRKQRRAQQSYLDRSRQGELFSREQAGYDSHGQMEMKLTG